MALADAIGKAAKQAGRDIAAEMNAEQKLAAAHRQRQQREDAQAQRLADREARQHRLAQIEAQKAERKALPTIRDVVLELLPGAIEIECVRLHVQHAAPGLSHPRHGACSAPAGSSRKATSTIF